MPDNPYAILGIEKKANSVEIKKAYKKLALKYHPDKNNYDDHEFKKINDAYQTLIDPKKREVYDMCNISYNSSLSSDELNKLVVQMINMISELIKQRFSYKKPFNDEISKSVKEDVVVNVCESLKDTVNIKEVKGCINLNIPVTIEELYNKQIKKINLKVKRFIDGNSKETVLQTISIFLSLLNYQDVYYYKGLGDDLIDHRGDIKITINIIENPIIKIDKLLFKYDLVIDDIISLYEIYYGVNKIYKFLNNEEIIVSKNFRDRIFKESSNGYSFYHFIQNKGLPYYNEEEDIEKRGDLYIFYSLKLSINNPDLLDSDITIEQFLKTHFNCKPA